MILVKDTTKYIHIAEHLDLPSVTLDSGAFVMFKLAIGERMVSSADSRTLQFQPFAFDVSHGDISGAFFFSACD